MSLILNAVYKEDCFKSSVISFIPEKLIIIIKLPPISLDVDLCSYFTFLCNRINITKPKNLICEFYLDKMLGKLDSGWPCNTSEIALLEHNFLPCTDFFLSSLFYHILTNRVFQVMMLCILVYLMQTISTVLCDNNVYNRFRSLFFTSHKKEDFNENEKKLLKYFHIH